MANLLKGINPGLAVLGLSISALLGAAVLRLLYLLITMWSSGIPPGSRWTWFLGQFGDLKVLIVYIASCVIIFALPIVYTSVNAIHTKDREIDDMRQELAKYEFPKMRLSLEERTAMARVLKEHHATARFYRAYATPQIAELSADILDMLNKAGWDIETGSTSLKGDSSHRGVFLIINGPDSAEVTYHAEGEPGAILRDQLREHGINVALVFDPQVPAGEVSIRIYAPQ